MHMGPSLSSGHYTAYAKIPENKRSKLQQQSDSAEPLEWLQLDDDSAFLLTQQEMEEKLARPESSTPYLLFYC
jgi:hypothetical protein